METKPGKSCTFPRLSAKRSTISSAAPSFTGRLLKTAITLTSRLLAGDYNAAAADAFGHVERLECLRHQLPCHLPVGWILGDADVDLESAPWSTSRSSTRSASLKAASPCLFGHDDADLVVAEAGEGGAFCVRGSWNAAFRSRASAFRRD